mmetsp:Transcript_14013/g.46410  ORF Transcript_14013/g.46410 Transcript_14013/m.46410 type:complete len:223 (-) Transcript_14013:3034-3702(-)
MNNTTACTALRCFQRRESTSHWCGVATTIVPSARSFKSTLVSPVRDTTFTPSPFPNRTRQSNTRSRAISDVGAMYTTFALTGASPDEIFFKTRRIANSQHAVFPLPVGAPTSALSSELYMCWNTWVCMGLKVLNVGYKISYPSSLNTETGSGARSSNSVGGGSFSGNSRCLKLTGIWVSEPSHESDTSLTKYCGGSGSSKVTVKLTWWSSSALTCFNRKNSW